MRNSKFWISNDYVNRLLSKELLEVDIVGRDGKIRKALVSRDEKKRLREEGKLAQ